MLGALALVVCLGAAGGVAWIVYFLYAPKARRTVVGRLPGRMILEPLFTARRAPAPPRSRMARGTGAVPQKVPSRDETTEKVIARPL
jgi:hypothetical protein